MISIEKKIYWVVTFLIFYVSLGQKREAASTWKNFFMPACFGTMILKKIVNFEKIFIDVFSNLLG